MFEKLEQLRKKSDAQKRMIALGTAFSITLVIFVFWFVSLTVSLSANSAEVSNPSIASVGSVSPLSALVANVKDIFSNIFSSKSSPATSSAPHI